VARLVRTSNLSFRGRRFKSRPVHCSCVSLYIQYGCRMFVWTACSSDKQIIYYVLSTLLVAVTAFSHSHTVHLQQSHLQLFQPGKPSYFCISCLINWLTSVFAFYQVPGLPVWSVRVEPWGNCCDAGTDLQVCPCTGKSRYFDRNKSGESSGMLSELICFNIIIDALLHFWIQ